jgi:hypothetical protein
MKILLVALIVFFTVVTARANYHATDALMNILTQFLTSPSTDKEYTTEKAGLLPKILNPLHWIPSFDNIPWNPDSELTTVSEL